VSLWTFLLRTEHALERALGLHPGPDPVDEDPPRASPASASAPLALPSPASPLASLLPASLSGDDPIVGPAYTWLTRADLGWDATARRALYDMQTSLGLDPKVGGLLGVIDHESGGKPSALNPLPAAGLFQLTRGANLPGFTTAEAVRAVASWDPARQIRDVGLPLYRRIFPHGAGSTQSAAALLRRNFLPAVAGQADDYVLAVREGSTGPGSETPESTVGGLSRGAIYKSNAGFDGGGRGYFTWADVDRQAAAGAQRVTSRGWIRVSGAIAPPGDPAMAGAAIDDEDVFWHPWRYPPGTRVSPETMARLDRELAAERACRIRRGESITDMVLRMNDEDAQRKDPSMAGEEIIGGQVVQQDSCPERIPDGTEVATMRDEWLRAAPSVEAPSGRRLPAPSTVRIVRSLVDPAGLRWYEVRWHVTPGWLPCSAFPAGRLVREDVVREELVGIGVPWHSEASPWRAPDGRRWWRDTRGRWLRDGVVVDVATVPPAVAHQFTAEVPAGSRGTPPPRATASTGAPFPGIPAGTPPRPGQPSASPSPAKPTPSLPPAVRVTPSAASTPSTPTKAPSSTPSATHPGSPSQPFAPTSPTGAVLPLTPKTAPTIPRTRAPSASTGPVASVPKLTVSLPSTPRTTASVAAPRGGPPSYQPPAQVKPFAKPAHGGDHRMAGLDPAMGAILRGRSPHDPIEVTSLADEYAWLEGNLGPPSEGGWQWLAEQRVHAAGRDLDRVDVSRDGAAESYFFARESPIFDPAMGNLSSGADLDAPVWVPLALPGGITAQTTADVLARGGTPAVLTFGDVLAAARAMGAIPVTRAIVDARAAQATDKRVVLPVSSGAAAKLGAVQVGTVEGNRQAAEFAGRYLPLATTGIREGGHKHMVLDPSGGPLKQAGPGSMVFYGWSKPVSLGGGYWQHGIRSDHARDWPEYDSYAVLVQRQAVGPDGEPVDLLDVIHNGGALGGPIPEWLYQELGGNTAGPLASLLSSGGAS
jgi:hypothetical protein